MASKLLQALHVAGVRLTWRALGTKRALALAGCAALLTFTVLNVLRPAPPPTVAVVVASTDLAVGHEIGRADVRTVSVPPGLVPEVAIEKIDDAVGQKLVTPLPRGVMVTTSSLQIPGDYAAAPAGTVATPVRFFDSQLLQILQPGDRIDVLATYQGAPDVRQAEVVARDALVLALPTEPEKSGSILGGGPADSGDLVVLAVPEAEVATLIAASQLGALSLTLVQ